jgi:Biotin-lipoyl like
MGFPLKSSRLIAWLKSHVKLGVLISLVIYIGYELLSSLFVYSRDAYVTTDLISLAPEVSARVQALLVRDNQTVRQGDILVRLNAGVRTNRTASGSSRGLREFRSRDYRDRVRSELAFGRKFAGAASPWFEDRSASLVLHRIRSLENLSRQDPQYRSRYSPLDQRGWNLAIRRFKYGLD